MKLYLSIGDFEILVSGKMKMFNEFRWIEPCAIVAGHYGVA
jgi:hypothetical protein